MHSNSHNSTYISFPSIEALPYVEASKETISEIESLVDIILSKKEISVKEDTLAEEDRIDEIVYELFDLDDEVIEIIAAYK